MLAAVLAVAVAAGAAAAPAAAPTFVRYLIVGAGPGGLQLGHFLDSAQRDYLILDKAPVAASFFARFPRWRQLISINKPTTGFHQLDVTQRQDWNTLLSEHSTSSPVARSFNYSAVPCLLSAAHSARRKGAAAAPPLVAASAASCVAADFSSVDGQYTVDSIARGLRFSEVAGDEYYPDASLLHTFLGSWASADAPRGAVHPADPPARAPLRIALNSSVVAVARPRGYAAALAAAGGSQAALIAAGTPRFAVATADGRSFECVFLAWAAGLQKLNHAEGSNVAEVAQSYWTHSTNPEEYRNKSVLLVGRGNAAFEVAAHLLHVAALVHIVGRDTARLRLATETHYPGDVRHVHSRLLESYLLKSQDGLAELPQGNWTLVRDSAAGGWVIADPSVPCRRDAHGRALERCLLGRSYDVVISCPGWHADTSVFAPDVRPALAPNKKHPALTAAYEAPGVPGLFFAGTLAHAADFRVSSGGFIHGFRYVVRALHRHLEEVEQAAAARAAATAAAASSPPPPALSPPPAAWPRRRVRGLRSAVSQLLRRANFAAGPFQMFGSLADVLVLLPLPARTTDGFTGVDPAAALVDPSSHYDAGVHDALLEPMAPPPPLAPGDTAEAARRASEAVLDAALGGAILLEEVPLRLAHVKAPLWAAQLVAAAAAGGTTEDPFMTSSGGGAEYLTLTLEFGGKATTGPNGEYRYALPDAGADGGGPAALQSGGDGPQPQPRRRAGSAHAATPVPTRRPVKAEWDVDPYALWRANSTFWQPELSRFLHPVLRYYHTRLAPADTAVHGGMPPPVLEHHILEDFNNQFTNFQSHVLSLARFLQDVAARRVAAARAVAAAPRLATQRVAASGQPAGGAPASVSPAELAKALARVFAVHRPFLAPMAAFLRPLMHTAAATLFFRGVEVPGGEAWFHRLSMAHADELLFGGGVSTVASHWLDLAPFPLTPPENATWQALQRDARPESVHDAGSHASRVMKALALSLAVPSMTPAQAAQQALDDALWREFFLDMSATNPRVPILVVRARNGAALVQAQEQGVPDQRPFHREIDVLADRQRDPPREQVVALVRSWAAAVGRSLAGSRFAPRR